MHFLCIAYTYRINPSAHFYFVSTVQYLSQSGLVPAFCSHKMGLAVRFIDSVLILAKRFVVAGRGGAIFF